LVWGAKEINREGENMWDPEFIGEIVYNPQFDFTKIQSQNYLMKMCEILR